MSLSLAIVLLAISTLALWLGAELLVRYAVKLGKTWGFGSGVIALTIIAAGTSFPELTTNIFARIENAPSTITLGSTIGSNIANIALILGSCILLFPITIHHSEIKELLILVLITLFFGIFMARPYMGFFEGAFLLILGLIALLQPWLKTKKKDRAEKKVSGRPFLEILLIGTGLVCVIAGSWGFIKGALVFAHETGMSYHFVAITIIALGTSLPEWATSLVAGWRQDYGFVTSQIVGSNIFNILTINGIAALIRPMTVDHNFLVLDWPIMALVTCLLWFFGRKKPIPKSAGVLFMGIYVFYIWMSA